ncbi:MAG TPA: hypothetical protein VHI13_14680 [Candidatus Kapabacteria bacterium]|nr:hypothetical protein [Candidatus Kapabacteria bacterium]
MQFKTYFPAPLLLPGLLLLAACSHARNTETRTTEDNEHTANSKAVADSARTPARQPLVGGQNAPSDERALPLTGAGGQGLPSDGPIGNQNGLPPTGGVQGGSLPSDAPPGAGSLPPTGQPVQNGGRASLPSEGGAGSGVTGRSASELARAALLSEPGFEQVTVADGAGNCLILGGSVHTAEKKMQAESLAKSASGASCVKNGIAVVK